MIAEAFDLLVSEAWAVSERHRRAIGERVILAAREPFKTVEELVERARGLEPGGREGT